MSEAVPASRAGFTAHGEALIKVDPDFGRFFAMSVAATETEDLGALTPSGLESVLREAYQGFGQRGDAPYRVSIWTPDQVAVPGAMVLDVFVADMPFLVDSVLGVLRSEGLGVRLMAHPILPVDTGTVPAVQDETEAEAEALATDETRGWTLLDADEEAPHYESFLHIHFDAVADEAVIARIKSECEAVLTDVARVVGDWLPMLERLRTLVQDYRRIPRAGRGADLGEAMSFLVWMVDHNFTFLGMRDYRLVGRGDDAALEPVPGSGLGILEDPDFKFLRAGPDYVEMTPQHVNFLTHPEPLLVTKANRRARVHRRGHMDYVGAKLYDERGRLTGELRILGLFTSQSLHQPHDEVPYVRRKISAVMRRSGHDPKSHAGKALMAALDSFPREELFQISEPDLYAFASEIAVLPDRPRLKVLPRIDPFDNFVSVLVFIPRDLYTSARREEIGLYLAERYDGRVSDYTPFFPEGDLVRVHFIIGRAGGATPRPDRRTLEADVADLLRSFGDRLAEASGDPEGVADWREAFSAGYLSHNTHEDALRDIALIEALADESGPGVKLQASGDGDGAVALKIYNTGAPIALSDRVPMLENFGFRVIDERTHTLRPHGRDPVYLHDMRIEAPPETGFGADWDAPRVEEAVRAIWRNEAESDPYSQLVLRAGLTSRETAVLRAYGHYLRQLGTTFSQRYLATTLGRHPKAAQALTKLFSARFDPHYPGNRANEAQGFVAEIDTLLESVASLDEDRIIRQFRNLVVETLRTNFFQRDKDGAALPALSFKLNSPAIEGMPAPSPKKEVFVYAPRLEGVHLRFGDIARGGIRWSDRPQDFRTEVLGLVKAQQVKNAIIVPVGAKGGFVPRQMPEGADRDTVQAEGLACYKIFIGALLDVTDNLDGDTLIPPPELVRTDGDDPYLVVAADKGTARFSDTANAISAERGFWLGDAFASGGSAGYDHKQMGITARGGWESVKRHFREMNRDIQAEPFTVTGVGDMSGDVFRQRYAAEPADPAGRRVRPSRHLHRSRTRMPSLASWSASACSSCRGRAGRTTTSR